MHVPGTFQSPPHHPPRGARRVCTRLAGRQGLMVLGLLGMALGVLGCSGDIGGSGQCGGSNDSDACVRIVTIEPVYLDLDKTTSDVDVVRGACPSGDPEPFTDHNAKVTLSNSPLQGVGPIADTSVTLGDLSIRYSLNACPAGATCPTLDTLTLAQTVTIPPNSSVTVTLPFVSLAKKFEYVSKGGSLLAFPSYTATYTITGTDSFHNSVSVRGSAQFTIGNFDSCPR
jgi:hypothetical protein